MGLAMLDVKNRSIVHTGSIFLFEKGKCSQCQPCSKRKVCLLQCLSHQRHCFFQPRYFMYFFPMKYIRRSRKTVACKIKWSTRFSRVSRLEQGCTINPISLENTLGHEEPYAGKLGSLVASHLDGRSLNNSQSPIKHTLEELYWSSSSIARIFACLAPLTSQGHFHAVIDTKDKKNETEATNKLNGRNKIIEIFKRNDCKRSNTYNTFREKT